MDEKIKINLIKEFNTLIGSSENLRTQKSSLEEVTKKGCPLCGNKYFEVFSPCKTSTFENVIPTVVFCSNPLCSFWCASRINMN